MTQNPFRHDTALDLEPVRDQRGLRRRSRSADRLALWRSKVLGGGLVLLAIASALLAAGFLMLAFGEHMGWHGGDGMLVQEDEVSVPAGQQQVVYYPIPYSRPPNLTLDDDMGHFVVVEQYSDHFCVGNRIPFSETVTWKARGKKAAW
jgi:hypothetical protein